MSLLEITLEIQRLLEGSRRILVASHIDPDGDAVGTQLAFGHYLRGLGKDVLMARDSSIPSKYQFLPEIDLISDVAKLKDQARFDTAVVLECPNSDRLGSVAALISPDTKVINIDHHPANVLEAEINWVDTVPSSVGEMVFEYFRRADYAVGAEVATQLYTAILTDTGRFRYACTSPRTLEIAGELVRAGADARAICDQVYYDMAPELVRLTGEVLCGLEYHDDGRICLMTLTRDTLAETGASASDTEGLVDHTLYPRGVQIGALLRDVGPKLTKVSFRSRPGTDVAKLASKFGGGGHVNAAGCSIELPVEAAKNRIVELLREARESEV